MGKTAKRTATSYWNGLAKGKQPVVDYCLTRIRWTCYGLDKRITTCAQGCSGSPHESPEAASHPAGGRERARQSEVAGRRQASTTNRSNEMLLRHFAHRSRQAVVLG